MTCRSCGRTLESGMRYCGVCGHKQSTQMRAAVRIKGMTFDELFRDEGPLDWRRTFEILAAACTAVADARARGDDKLSLEPESFYLEPSGLVTILDAGIANEPRDTEVMRAPPPWLHVSRPDYWSPEKLMTNRPVSASDVFTLAVIAYELVTGRRPYEGRGPAGVLTAQMKQKLIPPSLVAPDAKIPEAADAVLVTSLQLKPDKRYLNARTLGHAVAHVLATEPLVAAVKRPRQPRVVTPPRAPIVVFEGKPCSSESCKTPHHFRGPLNRTLVGHWLFFDHFDSQISRRPDHQPHPHAGIAALSYLFEGRLVHRDSLGTDQIIPPNTLAWFHAGRGAVHSDRHHPMDRIRQARLHGLELWVALPKPNEDDPPRFDLHATSELPSVVISGARVRVVLGEGFGEQSPVVTPTTLALFDVRLPKGAAVPVPSPRHYDYQRAVYVVSGAVEIGGKTVETRQLALIAPRESVGVTAIRDAPAHVVILGSAPILNPRYSWWYFCSSSKARLDDARRHYAEGKFGSVPGETEHVPVPE